jgi:hypothetical protein
MYKCHHTSFSVSPKFISLVILIETSFRYATKDKTSPFLAVSHSILVLELQFWIHGEWWGSSGDATLCSSLCTYFRTITKFHPNVLNGSEMAIKMWVNLPPLECSRADDLNSYFFVWSQTLIRSNKILKVHEWVHSHASKPIRNIRPSGLRRELTIEVQTIGRDRI